MRFPQRAYSLFRTAFIRIRSFRNNGRLFFNDRQRLRIFPTNSYSNFRFSVTARHSMMVDMRQFAHKQWRRTVTSIFLSTYEPQRFDFLKLEIRARFFPTETLRCFFECCGRHLRITRRKTILLRFRFCCFHLPAERFRGLEA